MHDFALGFPPSFTDWTLQPRVKLLHSFPEYQMKRFLYPILWSAVVALLLLSLFVFEKQDPRGIQQRRAVCQRKVSKDILKKVADGRGADFVRVIIQPANQADASIDSTLEDSGGSNIRKFKNFAVRVVTLPAQAAVNLASRSDVSYVSLNRDVRPMGHRFAHDRRGSDPEQWR